MAQNLLKGQIRPTLPYSFMKKLRSKKVGNSLFSDLIKNFLGQKIELIYQKRHVKNGRKIFHHI